MRVFIEWRNSLGCQIAGEYAEAGAEATETLRTMLTFGSVDAGDTFHILAAEERVSDLLEAPDYKPLKDR